MLNTSDPWKKIIELHKIRSPLYEEIANFTFNTDIDSPSVIADQIFDRVLSK